MEQRDPSRRRTVMRCALLTGLLWAADGPAQSDGVGAYQHLGVASCASSVCHGKLTRQDNRNVWLNEYKVWSQSDKHSNAYRLLDNELSREIARNLGIANARTATVCLDCHADNVAGDKRGPRFQITDGIGCEACHGGAENWLESHADAGATHEDNVARGMYPTDSPTARAQLCLTCHLGTPDKFAGHDILGAGHPRLAFELDTFSTLQPPHYEIDDDYRQRKGTVTGFDLWLAGQVQAARRYLDLLRSDRYAASGIFPELAFYDCHACHHPFYDRRWSPERVPSGTAAGSLRLQDQHLELLEVVIATLETPAAAAAFRERTEALVRAGAGDPARVAGIAAEIGELLAGHESEWSGTRYPREVIATVRRNLLRAAAGGRMSDYTEAEQVFQAVESLSSAIGDAGELKSAIDDLFLAVESGADFDPASFAATARRVQGRF